MPPIPTLLYYYIAQVFFCLLPEDGCKCKWGGARTSCFVTADRSDSGCIRMVFKQGFFCLQRSLVWSAKKPSFECKEALFENRPCRLVFLNGFRRDSCGSVFVGHPLSVPLFLVCFEDIRGVWAINVEFVRCFIDEINIYILIAHCQCVQCVLLMH